MHNLYVPPIKILYFIVFLFITGFASQALLRKDVPIPKFEITIAKTETESIEESEPLKVEPTWSSITINTNGTDRKYGNMVGMQVYLRANDFAKPEWWSERIEELLKSGKEKNIYDRKTIVIFPEHIGTGLLFVDEKKSIFEEGDINSLIDNFVSKHATEIAPYLENSKKPNSKWEASFRYKSLRMAEVYQETFSRLAKEYKVPILAGSIILPSPKVVKGVLVVDPQGQLYNVSVPFSAEGKVMDPLVRKTLITDEESSFIEAGELTQDRTWIVPGWKVAVFIGQEVFNTALYDRLKGKPLDGLVSPSVSFKKLDQEKIKSFLPNEDLSQLSENEIWEKFGLAKNIKTTRAIDAVQVFMHGSLFGFKTSGRTFNLRDFVNINVSESDNEPRILNLYF
ncbi:MAG: hydrolase, carbon-nitrogen family protein [Leptospira sp.]|nr:hydrolase, carbon-nitrogen family protein [Leptospira sp.]